MHALIRRPGQARAVFDELTALHDDMDRVFGGWGRNAASSRAGVFPPLDVWSTDEGLEIEAEIPGADIKDIDISVTADTVTLCGKVNPVAPAEGARWHCQERNVGEFVRTIQLPHRVDGKGVEATYRNGILSVKVPRAEDERPRKVEIKTA